MKVFQLTSRMKVAIVAVFAAGLCISAAGLFLSRPPYLRAQTQQIIWNKQEKPIADQIRGLRGLPDDVRATIARNAE